LDKGISLDLDFTRSLEMMANLTKFNTFLPSFFFRIFKSA